MDRKVSLRRRKYKKPWGEKCKDFIRHFLAFMFSNVGIIGLVLGYTVAGAFIFKEIEVFAVMLVKKNMTMVRLNKTFSIWKIANTTNILDETAWKAHVRLELLDYEESVARAFRNGYMGDDNVDENKSWSFPSAFLYSLTVITTIGYGNVVPRTKLGKITTIIYAIIGMPLFLLYLSNIGDIMARSFKWIYAKICLCRCCPGVYKKRAERRRKRVAQLTVEYESNPDGSESPEASIKRRSSHVGVSCASVDEEDDDNSEENSEGATEVSYDSQTVTVPVTICLAIMVGYILGGALLFSFYENEWSTLDGSYFCFISLSTIGFGDFVPGKAIYSDTGFELSSIFGSMYLMLGMALIAMCFNLMQEEVMHKIRRTMRTIKYVFRCNR